MDWNDIQHFLALARLGSVRAAGASLSVSHSTVARRVEALEDQLATRLFDRNRDGYLLTEAGRRMLPGAERIELEMLALERGALAQDERLAGFVTLTCSDPYISEILIRELTPFCEHHPEIELAVITDGRPFDLSKREADIAVRALGVGTQPPEALIALWVAPVVVANYVAHAHASRLDPERTGANTRWVSYDDRKLFESIIARSSYPDLPIWGAFSSLDVVVQAAREGLGLALLPTYVGDREPTLRRLERADLRHMGDFWLLCHPDLRDNARFRATRASVAQAFRANAALFRGEGWHADAPARPETRPGDPGDPGVR